MLDYPLTSSPASWKAAIEFPVRVSSLTMSFFRLRGLGHWVASQIESGHVNIVRLANCSFCSLHVTLHSAFPVLVQIVEGNEYLKNRHYHFQVCCTSYTVEGYLIILFKTWFAPVQCHRQQNRPQKKTNQTFCINIQRHRCRIPPRKNHASRGHLISLGGIERIPRRCEFVCDDITEVHQSLQALLQGFNCSCGICDIPVSSIKPCQCVAEIHTVGLDTQVHLSFRGMRNRVSAKFNFGAEKGRGQQLQYLREPR